MMNTFPRYMIGSTISKKYSIMSERLTKNVQRSRAEIIKNSIFINI